MKEIIIYDEAELELWHIVNYYEDKIAGLGLEFEKEVTKALVLIKENPSVFTKAKYGVRRYSFQRFPYLLYYYEFEEYIWVIAFAHTSRRPFYWKSRMQ